MSDSQTYQQATREYIQSAKGVSGAADILRAAIDSQDESDIAFAVSMLSDAADRYSGSTEKQARVGFTELATAEKQPRERLSGDLLATAALDLEVANTLLSAQEAAKPQVGEPPVSGLTQASARLNELTDQIALPMGKPLDAGPVVARFGFSEAAAIPAQASETLPLAKKNYEEHLKKVLEVLVAQTRTVLEAGFKGLMKLDHQEVMELFGKLGQAALDAPGAGDLLQKGIKLAVQAYEKLAKLLEKVGVHELQEKAKELFEKMADKVNPIDKVLLFTFSGEATEQLGQSLLEKTDADISKLDKGSTRLGALQTGFAEQMVLVKRIVQGATIGKGLAEYFLPKAATVPIFGGLYLLGMTYAVFAGMDYADSTPLLDVVEGVVTVTRQTLI